MSQIFFIPCIMHRACLRRACLRQPCEGKAKCVHRIIERNFSTHSRVDEDLLGALTSVRCHGRRFPRARLHDDHLEQWDCCCCCCCFLSFVFELLQREELQKLCVEPSRCNVGPTSSFVFWVDEKKRRRRSAVPSCRRRG